MDGKHPNRKKDKLNPYTLSIKDNNYYIEFIDGQGCFHKQEISMELYAAFNGFELDDISLMNEAIRHLTEADAGEEPLVHRIADTTEPVEDINLKIGHRTPVIIEPNTVSKVLAFSCLVQVMGVRIVEEQVCHSRALIVLIQVTSREVFFN